MLSRRSMFIVAGLAVLATGCATHALTSGRVVVRNGNAEVAISFSERDRALIAEYYGKRKRRLPPGLAKRRGGLPPGLAKRDKLPPGLRGDRLPSDLERRLARLPEGYVRVRIGRDIVLLDGRTRVVLDVVYDVAL